MTATTAIPLAVRTGFALNLGKRIFLYCIGTADMISVRRGCIGKPYLADALHLILFKSTVSFLSFASTSSFMISATVFTISSWVVRPAVSAERFLFLFLTIFLRGVKRG